PGASAAPERGDRLDQPLPCLGQLFVPSHVPTAVDDARVCPVTCRRATARVRIDELTEPSDADLEARQLELGDARGVVDVVVAVGAASGHRERLAAVIRALGPTIVP